MQNIVSFRTLSEHKALAVVVATAAALLVGFFILINPAGSHTDPGGCTDTGVGLSLSVFRSDGTTPIGGSDTVTPGELIKYKATLSHLGGANCNYEGGTLTITAPDTTVTDVTPGGGIPLVSSGFPFASSLVSYTVDSSDVGGDGDLDVSASYTSGEAHSADSHDVVSGSATKQTLFEKLDPSVVTEIHNGSEATVTTVPAGTTVHDEATVSGTAEGGTPTGSVDFTFYTSGDCTTGGSAAGTVALDGSGVAHPSTSQGPLNAGSYSFKAHYNGDTNYNPSDSACEPLDVTKLDSEVVTEIHDAGEGVVTSVPAGSTVHDKATVSGSFTTPTGNVDFTFYTSGDCTTGGSAAGTVALDGSGVAHPSSSQGPLGVGFYSFSAHYNGDVNYNPSDSACEPLEVTQFRSLVETQVHDASHVDITGQSVPFGTVVHDKATVIGNGIIVPTGLVSFDLFPDLNCATSPIIPTEIVALDLAGMAESSPVPGLPVGSYGYLVGYSGDQVYLPSQGICEPFHIEKLDSRVVTEVHDGGHNDITNTTLPAGSTVHDKATVFGIGPIPTGSVTFNLFPASDCSGQASTTEVVVLDVGGMAESSTTTALAIGNYGYLVSYGGDQVYNPSDSACEPFEIGGPTRTQGFWATHFDIAEDTFNSQPASYWEICPAGRDIDGMAELMGGFWSSIPYKSNGITKRGKTGQAQMQLIQQLLAAMLNKAAFGTDDGGDIAAGKTAYCGTDRAAMLAAAGDLGAYNSSGDAIPLPVPSGPADPQTSQSTADKTLWDTLP